MIKVFESADYEYGVDIKPFVKFDDYDFAAFPAMPLIYTNGKELYPICAKLPYNPKTKSAGTIITVYGNEDELEDDFSVGVDFTNEDGEIISIEDGNGFGIFDDGAYFCYGLTSFEKALNLGKELYQLALRKGTAELLKYVKSSREFDQ